MISAPAEPKAPEKPENKAIRSESILVAIALPRTVPSSSAGLPAPIAARSVKRTLLPTSEQVTVTDEVDTSVSAGAVPSSKAAAVTAGYLGICTVLPACPAMLY